MQYAHTREQKSLQVGYKGQKERNQEESWCFGLLVVTHLYCVITKKCLTPAGLRSKDWCPCRPGISDALAYKLFVAMVWSLGLCLMEGVLQLAVTAGHGICGTTAVWRTGRDSHFGYVHIRSRSMAPPDECHFLRSSTHTCQTGRHMWLDKTSPSFSFCHSQKLCERFKVYKYFPIRTQKEQRAILPLWHV